MSAPRSTGTELARALPEAGRMSARCPCTCRHSYQTAELFSSRCCFRPAPPLLFGTYRLCFWWRTEPSFHRSLPHSSPHLGWTPPRQYLLLYDEHGHSRQRSPRVLLTCRPTRRATIKETASRMSRALYRTSRLSIEGGLLTAAKSSSLIQ